MKKWVVFLVLIILGAVSGSAQLEPAEEEHNDNRNVVRDVTRNMTRTVLLNGSIDGSGLAIATGETWNLLQGYSLHILVIDAQHSQVMVRLLHDNDVVSQGWTQVADSFIYSKPAYIGKGYDNNNDADGGNNPDDNITNVTIFTITVDSIYEGDTRDLVMLAPIYQYMDAEYEPPAIDSSPGPDMGVSNKTPLNNNSKQSPSTGISIVIPIMLIAALIMQIKNKKRI